MHGKGLQKLFEELLVSANNELSTLCNFGLLSEDHVPRQKLLVPTPKECFILYSNAMHAGSYLCWTGLDGEGLTEASGEDRVHTIQRRPYLPVSGDAPK